LLSLFMLKQVLLEAVQAGGAELKRFFNKEFTISNKEGINNPVTEADHASEAAIINIIRKNFPDHQVLAEETGAHTKNSNYKWIIDPIDGTINFAHSIPLCAVAIAIEKDDEVIMAAVYAPILDELFFAEKGKGATLNDKKISVSIESRVVSSNLVTGFPYTYINSPNGPLEVFSRLIKKGIPVRRLGSACIDLCWVACGRFDGFYEHKLEPWDSAGGYLIVEEAGGRVTDHEGNKFSPYQHRIIATNGRIHDELLGVIRNEIEL
jgi:myo-inositol-1(or 4)-monophosphatase